MPRRPVIAIGAAALAIGVLLFSLGRGRERSATTADAALTAEEAAEQESTGPATARLRSARDAAVSALLGEPPRTAAAERDPDDGDGEGAGADDADPISAPDRTPEALLDKLASDDPYEVLDAADGLAARKVTRAIPTLAAMDIRKSADSAPSVIHALGQLGGHADPTLRKTATDRLVALLAQERARTEPESAGNVLAIYEALGKTHDPAAAPPLEIELRDPEVPLAARTVVVESLVELGQPSSRPAVTRARAEVALMQAGDELEAEIQQELLGHLDRALAALR
jgi:hypothetical protein